MSSREHTNMDEEARPALIDMTDRKMEEMAAAMKAVCDAAKADKARKEWMETEIARQEARANAAEFEKAALQDRVQQLEVALEEQGTKAALAWKWQQEVARLQEKLGKRSVELLGRDQDLEKLKAQMKEVASQATCYKHQLEETREALVASEGELASIREAHQQDVGSLQKKLAKARDRVEVVEAAYEDLREQATVEINDLRQKLADMSEELSSMSAKLGEANEQLAFNMAKRQTSRKKYNSLAEQLMSLSRSAAAASSSAGGGPAALTGAAGMVPASPFDGATQAQSAPAGEGQHDSGKSEQAGPGSGKAKDLLLNAHVRTIGPSSHSGSRLGVGSEQNLQSPTSSEASLPMHSPMSGFAAEGPGCVSIALSALSDDDDHTAGRGHGGRGFKSSLGYAGVNLGQGSRHSSSGPDSNLTRSSGVHTHSGSKRSGVLSMLKTATLATAVGAILSPRPGKKPAGKPAAKQDSVLARTAERQIRTLPSSPGSALSQEGPLTDGSSMRRSSTVQTQPVAAVPGSKGGSDARRSVASSSGDSLSQFGAPGTRARPGTPMSVVKGILTTAGSGGSPVIGAYRGSTVLSSKTEEGSPGGERRVSEKDGRPALLSTDDYFECGTGDEMNPLTSHFVTVDENGSECCH